jgi:hypothetical protein
MTSINASKTQATLGTSCLPELSRFILPPKEARFTVIKECVTVTGRVVWTHYFNDDGDANFNVVLDPPYRNMLGPTGRYLIEMPEMPGGITELHPVYAIKILP